MKSSQHNGIGLRIGLVSASAAMLGFLGQLGGCVSYTNVPVPESAPAFKSANHAQSISVVGKALETVISKHPVSGAYLINLPAGTSPESFDQIIAELPEGAMMPSDGMDEGMPTYHIGRVWIRASDAKVDVIYPFVRADGTDQAQNVTIWLSGGVRSWRVYREQYWAPGTIPTPPLSVPIVPDDEGIEAVPSAEPENESADGPAEDSAQTPDEQ